MSNKWHPTLKTWRYCIVYHAFTEQKKLGLSWYSSLQYTNITKLVTNQTPDFPNPPTNHTIQESAKSYSKA